MARTPLPRGAPARPHRSKRCELQPRAGEPQHDLAPVSKLRFLRGLGQVFKGEHLETLEVKTWQAAEVQIEADRPFSVYADGDPVAELPATIRILPGALRVIVPPDSVP